jgi:predicted unusual protein kinase regulating ubiquinone biosynthesis (AarF/ABC1/UbiB family)
LGGELSPLKKFSRTAEFWLRATQVYAGYKKTQVEAAFLKTLGWSAERIEDELWTKQHEWAGEKMYAICVDMRGFYLKGGQFLGARSDFIPLPICKRLCLLQDQVPPMPSAQAKAAIEKELGTTVDRVFEWIDLETPLGSASISQVHKAKLRLPEGAGVNQNTSSGTSGPLRSLRRAWSWLTGYDPEQARRSAAYSSHSSHSGSKRIPEASAPEDVSAIADTLEYRPVVAFGDARRSDDGPLGVSGNNNNNGESVYDPARIAKYAPEDGIVAVKIQYPNSLPTMTMDLENIRVWADFLSRTEIKFDMVSAVDELAKQIKLEFDFSREARIMNAVAKQFDGLNHKIVVPRSIPALVTQRLLVMDFIDGIPITKMREQARFQNLSEATKRLAARQILSKVSEAYGRMILLDGLFQADGHPGNILVMKGGRIGLIDYGQSKKLPDRYRLPFAKMVLALERKDDAEICEALDRLGVETAGNVDDERLKARIAWGMFDTEGTVNPFDPNSPIKQVSVENFPSDLFFVLRVSQLLRGLANGMNIKDFSAAKQWSPFAQSAVKELEGTDGKVRIRGGGSDNGGSDNGGMPSLEDFVSMLPIDGYLGDVPSV